MSILEPSFCLFSQILGVFCLEREFISVLTAGTDRVSILMKPYLVPPKGGSCAPRAWNQALVSFLFSPNKAHCFL